MLLAEKIGSAMVDKARKLKYISDQTAEAMLNSTDPNALQNATRTTYKDSMFVQQRRTSLEAAEIE
jgi:hypothetical protein